MLRGNTLNFVWSYQYCSKEIGRQDQCIPLITIKGNDHNQPIEENHQLQQPEENGLEENNPHQQNNQCLATRPCQSIDTVEENSQHQQNDLQQPFEDQHQQPEVSGQQQSLEKHSKETWI